MLYGLIAIVVLIVAYFIFAYNHFIRMENRVNEGWSGVDVQLKRRYDLIPSLVAVVKSYANYEVQTLERIVQTRNEALIQTEPKGKEAPENALVKQIGTVFALAEDYPDLKANEQFIELQKNLIQIEDTLQKARRYYNATVRDFNIAIRVFPNNLMAKKMKLSEKAFFEITPLEAKNPEVKL